MQKVKEVAHKMGIGHKGEQPASDKLGSSDQNTGATVGSAGTSVSIEVGRRRRRETGRHHRYTGGQHCACWCL
jgi:hypothetical protein